MESKYIVISLILVSVTLIGYYIAYLYGRRTKQFKWSEYVALIIWPFLLVVALAIYIDVKIMYLFIISSLIGFALEYVTGLAYHKTLNKRLWEYSRLNIGQYTSLLTLPFWGVAGVMFWILSKIIDL